MMPPGTVITRFRLRPGVVSTTYAVIALVIEPIGRSSTDDRDQRSAPFAAFASSAHRDRTPAGPAPVGTAAPAVGGTTPAPRRPTPAGPGRRRHGGPGGRGNHAARNDESRGHGTEG